MLCKWKRKWGNVDFGPDKCEVQHPGATNTDNTWRWHSLGVVEPQELKGLLLTGEAQREARTGAEAWPLQMNSEALNYRLGWAGRALGGFSNSQWKMEVTELHLGETGRNQMAVTHMDPDLMIQLCLLAVNSLKLVRPQRLPAKFLVSVPWLNLN